MKLKNSLKFIMLFLSVMLLLTIAGCGKKSVKYTITITGSAEESGVISLLGYSMNVYQDISTNPCGDCADQPVHLYVGADAEDAANAVSDMITRADDLWVVDSCQGNTVTLSERTPGSVDEIEGISVSTGYTVTTQVSGRSVSVVNQGSSANETESVEFPEDPQRLAAVYGPSYELLVMLGAEDKIVVRADVQTDDFPWAERVFSRISDVPALENVHTAVNFEELMQYQPDIVYTFPRQNELNQLAKAGVAAVAGESGQTLDDLKKQVRAYADTLGEEAQARAEDYCTYFDETLEKIKNVADTIPESERRTVYYAGTDILTTYGKYSDIIEVIEDAGGIAVSADLQAGNRSQIDFEQLMSWNPDVIFIDHGGMNDGKTVEQLKQELTTSSTYSGLSAVKNGEVYTSPSGVFYWDMGIQKILLVEYMAKTLYPDYFADLDMDSEIIDFYSRFFNYTLTREEAQQILERASD